VPPELEPLVDGVLEPLAAPLEGVEELGEVLDEPLAEPLAPPEAESFFVASADEEELEDDGELGGVAPALLDDEEGGVLGVAAEPDVELEPEPDGADAEPDGVVVEPLEEDDAPVRALSPALSPHAVSRLAPKTIDTATAKVESLMLWASLVGVSIRKQGARLTR